MSHAGGRNNFKQGFQRAKKFACRFALLSGASPQNLFVITCLCVGEIQGRRQCVFDVTMSCLFARDVTASLIRALPVCVCSSNPHMPTTMATHDQPLPGRSARDCCCYILTSTACQFMSATSLDSCLYLCVSSVLSST